MVSGETGSKVHVRLAFACAMTNSFPPRNLRTCPGNKSSLRGLDRSGPAGGRFSLTRTGLSDQLRQRVDVSRFDQVSMEARPPGTFAIAVRTPAGQSDQHC